MLDELILSLDKSIIDKKTLGTQRYLFYQQVSICFPENFYELSAEKVKERYSIEPRPSILYSDETGTINFGFHLLEGQNISLSISLSKIKDAIKMVYPNTLIYEEETISSEQKNYEISYFDFRTSSLEGAIYNILYLVSNKKKVVMGTFNCIFEKYLNWKPTAIEVIKTITIKD